MFHIYINQEYSNAIVIQVYACFYMKVCDVRRPEFKTVTNVHDKQIGYIRLNAQLFIKNNLTIKLPVYQNDEILHYF